LLRDVVRFGFAGLALQLALTRSCSKAFVFRFPSNLISACLSLRCRSFAIVSRIGRASHLSLSSAVDTSRPVGTLGLLCDALSSDGQCYSLEDLVQRVLCFSSLSLCPGQHRTFPTLDGHWHRRSGRQWLDYGCFAGLCCRSHPGWSKSSFWCCPCVSDANSTLWLSFCSEKCCLSVFGPARWYSNC